MDYPAFLNKIANRRAPTVLRKIFDNLGLDENFVLMAGGLPNPSTFPLSTATFTLSDGSTVEISESEMQVALQYGRTAGDGSTVEISESEMQVALQYGRTAGDGSTVEISEDEMQVALQYGRTAGDPRLREFCTKMNRRLHDPPLMKDDKHPGTPMIVCTAGSQDGIYKIFECIVEDGDVVLTDEPLYAAVTSVLLPLGSRIEGVPTDKDGLIPERLADILSKYTRPKDGKPATDSNGRKLKALYMIPNGGNPSGNRYTLERKRAIYKLAQEYNFLLVEDEAYYFLEKKPYSKSFLSLDVDGRVIRLDTFSKTVGPGFRIGTVTGPSAIVKKVLAVSMASSQGCSMVSQTVLVKLLDKWGLDGYMEHCERVAAFYDERRLQCVQLVEKHLKGLVEYEVPTGGMFLWLKCLPLKDTMDLCVQNLIKRKVLMVAGSAFMVDERPSPYMRVSFTMAPPEQLDRGLRILAEEIRVLSGMAEQRTNGV